MVIPLKELVKNVMLLALFAMDLLRETVHNVIQQEIII